MMHLRQDQKEVWKCVECIGGSMMKKHQQFPVERFREDLQLKKERVIQKNLRIMTFLGT